MITAQQCKEKFNDVQSGKITEDEWKEFCRQYLEQLLSEPKNREVMLRLKQRGD